MKGNTHFHEIWKKGNLFEIKNHRYEGIGHQRLMRETGGYVCAAQLAGITLKDLKGKVELPDPSWRGSTSGNLLTVAGSGNEIRMFWQRKVGIKEYKISLKSKPEDLLKR